jgi:penicillin-binding protein 1A
MSDYKSRQERRKATSNKKGNRKKKSIFKKVLLSLILIFLFIGLAGSIAAAIIISNAPPLDPSKLKEQAATRIYYADGSLMETVGSKNRIYAPIDKIPDVLKNAVISVEDARFYSHHGIDPIRIGGSIIANITEGFGAEGASTIDQQLIKRSYLTPKKTLTRKIQEAYLAIKLDREYSKDKILEMYLNKIFYGERSYGVATAAYTYFGLDLDHLDQMSLSQAALLAGIPNRPTDFDPITHPDNAIKRRNVVLDAMVNNGIITQEQADKAKKVTIKEMLKNRPNNGSNDDDHYAVVDMLKQLYVDTGKIDKDQWSQGGLRIYTTIDKKAQKTVEQLLNNDANFEGTKDNFQAGIAVTDTQNGSILAIGGGVNYQYGTNWALAGSTEKGTGNQIGSTAKPIVDYGPAIEYLKWPTSYILDDSPHSYTGGRSVSDWDDRYLGKMTMKLALAKSRNVPAVRALQAVDKEAGVNSVQKFTSKLGVTLKNFNESYALGSFTANPLQMASAYATFGNNGIYNAPHAIKYIEYPDGRKVKFDHENHIAMHDYTAYMITDMLKEVVVKGVGTYSGPSLSGYTVAGKSGSSNPGPEAQKRYHLTDNEMNRGYLDSWFVGYTPKITTAVWTGYDQSADVKNKGYVLMSLTEKHISNNLFGDVIRSLASTNTPDWKQPKSVVKVSVEKDTGLLASDLTPKDDIMSALFVRGTEPTKVSTKYQKLEAPKKVKATYNKDKQTITLSWDYDRKDNISFEIGEMFNGQFQPLANTQDHKIDISNLNPGQTYEFSVTAIYVDPNDESKNKKSDPATVSIQLPGNTDNQGPPNGPQDKKCEKHPDDPKCGPVTPPPPPTDGGGDGGGGDGGDPFNLLP